MKYKSISWNFSVIFFFFFFIFFFERIVKSERCDDERVTTRAPAVAINQKLLCTHIYLRVPFCMCV